MSTAAAPLKAKKKFSALRHRIQAVKDGIETFAQTTTRNFDLRVYFSASNIVTLQNKHTKKFTIVLPELSLLERPNMSAEEEKEAEDFLTVIWGYTWHECGHVMVTDFEVTEKARKHGGPKCQFLLNVLEDLRIEQWLSDRYAGAEVALRFMNRYVFKERAANYEQGTIFAEMVAAMSLVGNYGKAGAKAEPMWALLSRKARRIARTYSKTIIKAKTCKDTEAAWRLTKKLWDALGLEDEKPPETEEEKQKHDELQENAAEPDGDEGEPTPQEKQEEEEDAEQRNIGPGLHLQDDDGTVIQEKDDVLRQRIQQELERQCANPFVHHEYLIYTTEGDTMDTPRISLAHKEQFQRHDVAVRQFYGPVKRGLESKLRTRALSVEAFGLYDGELDVTALHRVRFGSRDVFKELYHAPSNQNVVASMWIDVSGSMNEKGSCTCGYKSTCVLCYGSGVVSKYKLATMAAMVFGFALDSIRTPFEIVSYSTSDAYVGHNRYHRASATEQNLYARWGDLHTTVHKDFKESWKNAGPRLMAIHTRYNTFDGECVRLACQRLMKQPQQRKVLFVLNDGEPCPNVSQKVEVHQAYLREVVQATEGVEIIAIGILTDAVAKYYPNYVVVHSLEELPNVVVQQLGKILLGKATH